MKTSILASLTIAGLVVIGWVPATSAEDAAANPLAKALQLLNNLAAQVTADGESQEKDYRAYVNWCDSTAKNTQNEVKTASVQKEKLEAKVAEFSSAIEVGTAEISELAGAIAEVTQRLEKATSVREQDQADFVAAEKELSEVVDTVGRAVAVLEREMEKSPTAFAQVGASGGKLAGVLQALSVITEAAGFTNADQSRLAALVQTQEDDEDEDGELGAPAAAAHKSQSGGIVEVLEDMKEKAELQLSDLRKSETKSRHEYEMLKQTLEDGSAADKKDLADEKAALAQAKEALAVAEGDLVVTTKDLKASNEELDIARKTCMSVAADHEMSVSSRVEELKVIAEATKVLQESQSGAASFLQVASRSAGASTSAQVANLIAQLARKHHSAALAQLSSRITAATRYGSKRGSPFEKVKTLVVDMIAKLEKEAAEEASEKGFCDEEQGKTEGKKGDLQDDVSKIKAKIDQSASKSAQLKEEVTVIQAEVAEMAKAKSTIDEIRRAAHADYVKTKTDLEKGLAGVRKAIDMLRDYYASKDDSGDTALLQDNADESSIMHQPEPPQTFEKNEGAGTSIIGLLEVIESDSAKELTAVETEESDSQAAYGKQTQEFELANGEKTQAVKFKTQEFKGLDKSIAEQESDLGMVSAQLDDVLEYDAKLKERCVAKPDSYAEKKARRDAEIEGLKQAMVILDGEGAFLQQRRAQHTRRGLRGSL